jgi:hypothetical protein
MEPPSIHRTVNAERLNHRHRKSTASRVTNGSALLLNVNPGCVDGRSAWCRRLRDLLEAHVADLGGWSNITAAEAAILRRAVTLCVELERREAQFARVGAVDDVALSVYSTASNTLRRLLESLGLQRRAKDITPTLADIIAGLDNEETAAKPEAAAKNGGAE